MQPGKDANERKLPFNEVSYFSASKIQNIIIHTTNQETQSIRPDRKTLNGFDTLRFI